MSTTTPSTPEAFDPSKFVQGLPSEHLAIIAEFADEADTQLRLLSRAGKNFQAPSGKDMLLVFKAAEIELSSRFSVEPDAPDARELPQKYNDYAEKNHLPTTSASEWVREMRDEVLAPAQADSGKDSSDDDNEDSGTGKKKRKGMRLPAIATPNQIHKMFDVTAHHPRNHLVVRVLYASGIRRQELVDLLVADLYLDRNILFVRGGKADKDRYVLIDDETSRLLREYTRELRLEDKVFNVSTRTINRIVDEAAELSGAEARFKAMGRKFTVHSLRHCFATHMYESGADLFLLKTLLGHLFLNVTKMYVHVGVRALTRSYQRCHPLARNDTPPQDIPQRDNELVQLEDDED